MGQRRQQKPLLVYLSVEGVDGFLNGIRHLVERTGKLGDFVCGFRKMCQYVFLVFISVFRLVNVFWMPSVVFRSDCLHLCIQLFYRVERPAD